jgi:hypothetical protein
VRHFNGVVDSWVRNVSILNSDYGVNLNGSFFCTVDGVTLGTSFDRGPLVGHHGLTSAGGADHLFTRFDVRNTFVHDLSVDSYTLGSVWADGSRAGVPHPCACRTPARAPPTGTSPRRATSRCRQVISAHS